MNCHHYAFRAANPDVFPSVTGEFFKAVPAPEPITPFPPLDEPEEIEVMPLSATEFLLIAVIVLACTGLSAYLITRLVERLSYYF